MPSPHAGRRVEAAFLAGTAAVTTAAVVLVLRLWQADPRVPFVYYFDALFNATAVKSVVEHGWFLRNPSLGAPAGLELYDFPLGGDNLHFLLIKGLGLLSGDWALVMNAYFLLGFVLVALAAYAVLRQIGSSQWTALALATLFTLLPYHFVLGEIQLFQSAYFAVPLGALLVFDALGWDIWRAPFLARARTGQRRSTVIRWAVRVVLIAVVASAGSYYAPFTMALVAFAAVLNADRRAALRSVAVIVLLAAVLAANNLPTLLYVRDNGANTEVANRAPGENDLYSLRVIDLFLPAQYHRLEPLAALKARLDRFWPVSPVWPSPQTPLGAAGATGLAISVAAVVSAARPSRRAALTTARARVAQLGLLNLGALLLAVATGFSGLLALVGLTQVRVWSRLSVFVAFFALAALGQVLQARGPGLWARLRPRRLEPRRARILGAGIVVAAFTLAVLDQTQPAIIPPYAGTRPVFVGDRAFVAEIERRMPPGSAVLQLPLASFPERLPIVGVLDYGLLRGYLHSRTLRWSYAAMRGRPADWTWSLGGRPVGAVVDAATAAGFTGLYLDRAGFADQGFALEAELAGLVGPPAVVGAHGLVFWDLRDRAEAQRTRLGADGLARMRRQVLAPVVPSWEGFGPSFGTPADTAAGDFPAHPAVGGQRTLAERGAASPAVLELRNPLSGRRDVRLQFELRTDGAGDGTGTVTIADTGAAGGIPTVVAVDDRPRAVEIALVLPPGATRLRFTSAAAAGGVPPPGPVFLVANVRVVDSP